MSKELLWCDVETTGLDTQRDRLLEVALVVTDGDLNEQGAVSLPVHADRKTRRRLKRANPHVRRMHTENGLIAEVTSGDGLSLQEVRDELTSFIGDHLGNGSIAIAGVTQLDAIDVRRVPLAGSSVHFDRAMLQRWLPSIEMHTHYRNVDVSTVRELAKRWYPSEYEREPKAGKAHRALADVRDSIELARHYRETFLNPYLEVAP